MLNILSGNRVRYLDAAYVEAQGISSWQLMERAAVQFANWFIGNFSESQKPVLIFCGPGNNGGDGVAIARLISERFSDVTLIHLESPESCSLDFQHNWGRLPQRVATLPWDSWEHYSSSDTIVIDGIFGVGINRPVEGKYALAIKAINELPGTKVSIDIPSGIPADACLEGTAVRADFTVTFQFPKLSLMFPEHASNVGEMVLLDIGFEESFVDPFSEGKYFLRETDIPPFHKVFHGFSHKGDFGRVLLIGGSTGKIGAMVLAARAALRTGSGLVSVSIPQPERQILQIAVPEAMVTVKLLREELSGFDAIGIGPGWGTAIDPLEFEAILNATKRPVVVDADGLNALAKNPHLLDFLPAESILTPHLKEFERLAGPCSCHRDRLEKAREYAATHRVYLVLKGAFSVISFPNGKQYFNSTGNKFMATAGSGDVLTGMLTSFLGQGYSSKNAVLCGVFHHGMAGDLAGFQKNRGLIASDIVEAIPSTFVELNLH